MTPWNPTTPFSGFTPGAGRPGAEPDARLELDDRTVAQPLPRPASPNPLGFVDVRSSAEARPVEPDGVAYRTELSFAVRTWDSPRAQQDVPFYKREISFRRKRQEEPAMPEPSELAPLEEAGPVVDEPVSVEEPPRRPIGFAPAGEDETAAEAVASEPEPDIAQEAAVEEEAVEAMSDPDPEPEIEPETDQPELAEPELEIAAEEPAAVVEMPAPEEKKAKKPKKTSTPRGGRNRRARGRKVVGLRIGSSGISAAVVANEGGRHELHDLARVPLESGVVVDGEIRDPVGLERALRTLFSEYKLPRDVRIGLASNRIGVRTFDIAGIDDQERFNNAVRFKAHEVLPIAGTESVLDYRVIDTRHLESGEEMRRVLLVVAPSDQVGPYVDVCAAAGLRLVGIDLEALGLLRAFVHPDLARSEAGQDTATVIVGMGHGSSTLLVAGGGAAEFTRVFDWGGVILQNAIAEELDVSPGEAALILGQVSLAGPAAGDHSLDVDTRLRAVEAVRLRLTPFARELVASLQFYQTQPESLGIGEIVITGATSRLDGLSDFLHQMIGVPVRVGDPLARVEPTADALVNVDETDLPTFAAPIGLAIEDDAMRSVNLVPGDARQDRAARPRLAVIAIPAAAAFAAVAIGGAFFFAQNGVSDKEADLQAVEAELAALPEPGGLAVVAPGVEQETAARATSVAAVLGTRLDWDRMLRDLSRVLPGNVWLTTMRAQVPTSADITAAQAASTGAVATTSGTTGVELQGYTYDQEDVATLLGRLETLPTLSDVQLRSSAATEIAKKQVIEFNITATLSPGGTG
jgi:type IV pilus assembly protein PilM